MPATFVPRRYDDGSVRIDVTVTYALRGRDLVQLLASAYRTTDADSLPKLRYTETVAVLRRELRAKGCDAPFFWRDHFTDDDQTADHLEQWARKEIARTFPALGPAA
ncbi:hypothetical protein AB0952_08735 [Streptomyces caniferus]|uniref:hypothetical protein n=1 Tax=Streptomyces caniferus TaxID=285557 RepID=UPI0034517DBD